VFRFSLTPTVTSGGGGYAANDVIGGRLFLPSLAPPPGIWLRTIVIADKAAQNVDYVLTFFDAAPTTIADNDAITTLNDADPSKIIHEQIIDAATYRRTYTANSIHRVSGLDVPLLSNASGDLYAFLWTTSTPTYGSVGDINLYLLYDLA